MLYWNKTQLPDLHCELIRWESNFPWIIAPRTTDLQITNPLSFWTIAPRQFLPRKVALWLIPTQDNSPRTIPAHYFPQTITTKDNCLCLPGLPGVYPTRKSDERWDYILRALPVGRSGLYFEKYGIDVRKQISRSLFLVWVLTSELDIWNITSLWIFLVGIRLFKAKALIL